MENVDELLESAIQLTDSRAQLAGGFYTAPLMVSSCHHLSDRDIDGTPNIARSFLKSSFFELSCNGASDVRPCETESS